MATLLTAKQVASIFSLKPETLCVWHMQGKGPTAANNPQGVLPETPNEYRLCDVVDTFIAKPELMRNTAIYSRLIPGHRKPATEQEGYFN